MSHGLNEMIESASEEVSAWLDGLVGLIWFVVARSVSFCVGVLMALSVYWCDPLQVLGCLVLALIAGILEGRAEARLSRSLVNPTPRVDAIRSLHLDIVTLVSWFRFRAETLLCFLAGVVIGVGLARSSVVLAVIGAVIAANAFAVRKNRLEWELVDSSERATR